MLLPKRATHEIRVPSNLRNHRLLDPSMASLLVPVLTALISLTFAYADDTSLAKQLAISGHSGFARLVELANITSAIEAAGARGGVTVFAPTDKTLMHEGSLSLLPYLTAPGNEETRKHILLYHMVDQRISAFKWAGTHPTLEGSSVALHLDSLSFQVADVGVTQYNTVVDERMTIHSISNLLIPPSVEDDIRVLTANVDDGVESRRVLVTSASRKMKAGAEAPVSLLAPAPDSKNLLEDGEGGDKGVKAVLQLFSFWLS